MGTSIGFITNLQPQIKIPIHTLLRLLFRGSALSPRSIVLSRCAGHDSRKSQVWLQSWCGGIHNGLFQLNRRACSDCLGLNIRDLLPCEHTLCRPLAYAHFILVLFPRNAFFNQCSDGLCILQLAWCFMGYKGIRCTWKTSICANKEGKRNAFCWRTGQASSRHWRAIRIHREAGLDSLARTESERRGGPWRFIQSFPNESRFAVDVQ